MSDLNFSIAYPEITWDALTITASEASGFPVRNLFYNGSGVVWKRSGTATSTSITFDLGETKKSSANYCILRGINNIVLQQGDKYGVTVQVRASIDNFVTSDVLVSSQNPIEFVGTKDEDAVILFDKTAEYRYWRVVIITATAIQHQLRKLFIGNLFDFNSNSPFYPYVSKYQETANAFVSDRGTLFKSSNGKKQKLIDIAWRNVLDSTRDFFQSRIIEAKDDSPFCFVHKDSMHNPLTVYKKPKTIADFKPVAYYKSTDVSKIFTLDSGGTLPAYGVGVGRWENAFGSAHATQATAGSRPIRSTAPITGVRNLQNHSQDFTNASAWLITAPDTVTPNTHIAPDGTLTASTVNGNSLRGFPFIDYGGSGSASCFFKLNGGTATTVRLYVENGDSGNRGSAAINLTNGNVVSLGNAGNTDFNVENYGNDWVRLIIQTGGTGSTQYRLRFLFSDGTFVIWGSQLSTESVANHPPYQRRVTQHEVYEAGVPNRDYLSLNGTSHWLDASGLASVFHGNDTPFTIIAVARPTIGAISGVLASYGTSTSADFRGEFRLTGSSGSRLFSAFRKDSAAEVSTFSSTPYTNEQSGIFTKVFKGQSVDFIYNGNFVLNNGSLNKDTLGTNPNRFAIGARSYSFTDIFFTGDYYALLIFNKALTNADRQYVESLLSEDLQVANIQAPQQDSPNLLTAWIREYEIESGVNANLNNVSLSLLEDII